MPETPVYSLPYPVPTDPADIPADLEALAAAVDAVLASGKVAVASRATNLVTAVTSFAASASLFSSDIGIQADGVKSYLVRFAAVAWANTAAAANNVISLSLDGADGGTMVYNAQAAANANMACVGSTLIKPASGHHNINVRPWVGAGSVTILGGAGEAAVATPILLTVQVV